MGQWKELAGRIVRAIREADPNHLLIVEKAMGVTGVPGSENSPDNFFLVPDDNTAYTFHFYDPMEFCFQGLAFFGVPNRARYPDRDRVVPPSDMSWAWATFGNPPLEPGNTDWKNYTGEFRPATNADWIFAFPVFQSARNSGTAFLRSYEVQEYDPATRSVRTVLKTDVAAGEGWLYWSENGSGRMEFGTLSGRIHVALSGTTGDASAVNTALGFPVRTGRHYRISGEMSGRLVPRDAACLLRVDFYRSPSGTGILNWDRAFLESRLERMVRFGETNNVPLYVGEFGANRLCFEKDRGGLAWVADALEFFEKAGLSYTYHAYHEGLFGIYTNDDGLPRDRDLNRPLADLISRKMRR